jgi:hypothetical protein
MTRIEAKRVIEALRMGIPVPDGFVRAFTVGRAEEIAQLGNALSGPGGTARLLNANYGSGKTQMLRFLREDALEKGYAVALVVCDCKSGIRFNRMDQVFGAVCKNLEFPGGDRKGVLPFLWAVQERCAGTPFWNELSSDGAWSRSETLQSPAMYVAFRACRLLTDGVWNLLEDWLQNPQAYKAKRKLLYEKLVSGFRDPRPDWKFYQDGVFWFDVQGYDQSWKALSDLDTLAKQSGMKGLVLLFDEFEDIITNLKNIQHQETAMLNLLDYNEGRRFSGHSFFAVTPEFVHKCTDRLEDKGRCDFEFKRFRGIKKFEMSPLDKERIIELVKTKIIPAHGIAHGWNPVVKNDADIASFIEWVARSPDRTRLAVKTAIQQLDVILDEQE